MKDIQLQAEVEPDGVLNLSIPLGPTEAGTPVVVTISSLKADSGEMFLRQTDWHEFVQRTYGSCAGLGLEEPQDTLL